MRKAIDWDSVKRRLAATGQVFENAQASNAQRMSAVFGQRAARLARVRAAADASQEDAAGGLHALSFRLGGGTDAKWALELHAIAEVLPLGRFTPVPAAPTGLLGVFNLRGEIVPIIELAALLQIAAPAEQTGGYVLMLRGAGIEAGFKVEQVFQIKRYTPEEFFPAMQASGGEAESSIKAVGRDGTQILSMDTLLNHEIFRNA